MDKDRLIAVLRRDEGVRSKPYWDSRGILTVGVGRNLGSIGISLRELSELAALRPLPFDSDAKSKVRDGFLRFWDIRDFNVLFPEGLSEPQIDVLLQSDIERCVSSLVHVIFPGPTVDDPARGFRQLGVGESASPLERWLRDHLKLVRGPSPFFRFPDVVQEVLVNLVFNLGAGTFKKFRTAIVAFLFEDWHGAADAILDSRAVPQTRQRYLRLAYVLRTQDPAGFELEGPLNIL